MEGGRTPDTTERVLLVNVTLKMCFLRVTVQKKVVRDVGGGGGDEILWSRLQLFYS